MKRKVTRLRPSPNEEARLIQEEYERRRKLRIQQVREQQRCIALHIRRQVEQRRQHELKLLEEKLREDWERQRKEEINRLQTLYEESLQLLGQGHRSAKENEPDLAAIAQKEEENHTKAEERYREALKELKSQKLKDHERQSRSINARRKALQTEKERAAKVASLPPPPQNPLQIIDSKKLHVVKKSDVSAFAATHYHMPETTVDSEVDPEQPNACEEAELQVRRLQDLEKEERRRRAEQLEKARLRGKEALRREHLVQDRERLLVELEHMQQTDLLRRRQQVSQMPPQIFQPLYKRQEMREDFQREMEFAFEDMYAGERRVKGDLVVQLVPEPLPALSINSQDQELDVTLDEVTTPGAENSQHDSDVQESESSQQDPSAAVPAKGSKPAAHRALRNLLDRIRSQRNQWTERSSHGSAADSPTGLSNQIPERDTTIDTGSLSGEDKDKQLPDELHEPEPSPPALEMTEQSAAAESHPPEALVTRIQEFEEERKRREEELEQEKQQQVAFLQELEEQKSRLEQMLLEAQQEREHLKTAVTQEEPTYPPEEPAQDQEVASVAGGPTPEVECPPGEDLHIRRIREYQQRLVEQNRLHQRSVEVARQRLDQYQRALRVRHNMAASTDMQQVTAPAAELLPAAPSCVHVDTRTSVEIPTRESDTLSSPPRHYPPLPRSSLRVCSKFPLNETEIPSDCQRPDVSQWLTDRIMERVTEHLPETMRPHFTTSEAPPGPGAAAIRTRRWSHDQTRPSPEDQVEKQRLELQEAQRRVKEQREVVVLRQKQQQQQQQQEEERQRWEEAQREVVLRRQQEEEERQRWEEAQREVVVLRRQQEEERQRWEEAQREVVVLRRQQEEERQRREEEVEQMRRQRKALQALIHTEAQPSPEASSAASQRISQTRRQLLASLLKAIEESNGGSLSHLEDPLEREEPPQPASSASSKTSEAPVHRVCLPSGPSPGLPPPPPPRAAKPPVTRVRLGVMEVMTQQHELSAIQEVETPANISQITELEVSSHPVDWDPQQETLQTPSWLNAAAGSEGNSGASSRLAWREQLLTAARRSPVSSESDSVLKIMSPLSSDSGRGADFSGPGLTSCRSLTEVNRAGSTHRPPDSDSFSSTTISTGSYITTDPEQNLDIGPTQNESPTLKRVVEVGPDVSSPSDQSSNGLTVETLFNDSSIQRIIEKYTRELNESLCTAGRAADGEGSSVEELDSAASQMLVQALEQREDKDEEEEEEEEEGEPDPVGPVLEPFSPEDPSVQDSFRPLVAQLADQSSCLASDHRDSTMEQLFGHPSAHSSVIGQLPGPSASLSLDPTGWDSTLSRMIGRLACSSLWPSGAQDFYAGQLMGEMATEQATTWLEGSPMRPLVGELDQSAGAQSSSSGQRSEVNPGVSHPALPPEASVPAESPQTQDQRRFMALGPDWTEGSESFHQLLAEVTHNETAEPSLTFHLPDLNTPTSPEGHGVSSASVESEQTPECLRAEESSTSPVSQESFTQLITSQLFPHESVVVETEVELTAQSLATLTVCDAEELRPDSLEAAGEKGILEQSEITLVSLTDTTLQDQQSIVSDEDEDQHPDEVIEEEQRGRGTEGAASELEETEQTHPVTVLEIQWGPGGGLQGVDEQRRRALLQKSTHRVQEMKAKKAQATEKFLTKQPGASEAKTRSDKVRTRSEPQQRTRSGGPEEAERQQKAAKPDVTKEKAEIPAPAADSRLKKTTVEVKVCSSAQRKRDVSEMHQRTQRLYEQLEEVKQQKAARSRRESSAQNRLKAKEFHQKTLLKLRAKQTLK